MATTPASSSPLHNFPLSFLKWGHRRRRLSEPISDTAEDYTVGKKESKEGETDKEERAWNLRARRAAAAKEKVDATEGVVKSARLRGLLEGHVSERKVLWIALSREEIDEDVYAMTGGRPMRRAKKRAKTVQKQLDSVFPGLYLDGLTAESYQVHEATK